MTKKYKNRIGLFCFSFLLLIHLTSAQIASPFNKLSVVDTAENYSFIVGGHFHGESTNQSTFPASTIIAAIDTLNSFHPNFLMSLGDLFIDVNETYVNNYQKSLFNKLQMPIFNAVGNHDLSNGNMYEKIYGKTFFSFISHSSLFVVLNTEVNDGSIKGEQFEFFKNALLQGRTDSIKNIFIFSHRPIWSENNLTYENLFIGNSRTEFGTNNFEEEIKPLLTEFSKVKSIYWMSGSMASGPVSFFYHKESESRITFLQTAIRDLPRDAVLLVTVVNGQVAFKGISITGQNLEPIESYDLDYWKKNSYAEEPFNYRMLPYLTKKMLMHYYFWIGFVSSLLVLLVLRFILAKWKRRR